MKDCEQKKDDGDYRDGEEDFGSNKENLREGKLKVSRADDIEPHPRPSAHTQRLNTIIRLYSAADRLFATGLREAAKDAFVGRFKPSRYLDNGHKGLLDIGIKIYRMTPTSDRGLRDAFLTCFGEREYAQLVTIESRNSSSIFEMKITAAPDLATDLHEQVYDEMIKDEIPTASGSYSVG